MGLDVLGVSLNRSEIAQYTDLVHNKGTKAFINLYKRFKDLDNDSFKWGDEVEFSLVKLNHEKKKGYLLLKAEKLLPLLQIPENNHDENLECLWRAEYGNYMVEGTPGKPYQNGISDFRLLEENMRLRRKQVNELLNKDEFCASFTVFPLLGCDNFTFPYYKPTPNEGAAKSLFLPDQVIYNGHPRFYSLTKNIRERCGSKISINIPIYFDKNTPKPFIEEIPQINNESKNSQKENHIFLDSPAFGSCCSCLQMTVQAKNLEEARHLFDQLAPLTPIMLALSAASPIWRGYLSDIDCRWNVFTAAVDDRTDEELGKSPLNQNKYRIYKSRYDSIESYLSPGAAKYNDIDVVINERAYKTLIENNIDHLLAQHIANIFIREPISLFKDKLDIDDEMDAYHFVNLHSTVWQTIRLKPPPLNERIGWRVEFRPTELQITDFENAAFVTFLVLFTRVILSFRLNLLIPISKIDENMQSAQKRNACLEQKFYFRKSLFTTPSISECTSSLSNETTSITKSDCLENEYELMTINDIVNGNDNFPGLIPLIKDYLKHMDVDSLTQNTIKQYLRLIEGRARGNFMTNASYIRHFVQQHPKYQHDSRVNDEIAYDLLVHMKKIAYKEVEYPDLLFKAEV